MSDLKQKLKTAGAIAALGGGALFTGSQVGKPECDFVFVDSEKEVCMTEEQVKIVIDNLKGFNTGFGGSQFQDVSELIKKK